MIKKWLWLTIGVAVAVGLALQAGCVPSGMPEEDLITPWVMAQDFVESNLKSPGTASYGGVWEGDYQSASDCVTSLGDDKYRVNGWVDSQNAFGGTVRIDFVCEVEDLGDEKWRCNSLEMNQRGQ